VRRQRGGSRQCCTEKHIAPVATSRRPAMQSTTDVPDKS